MHTVYDEITDLVGFSVDIPESNIGLYIIRCWSRRSRAGYTIAARSQLEAGHSRLVSSGIPFFKRRHQGTIGSPSHAFVYHDYYRWIVGTYPNK